MVRGVQLEQGRRAGGHKVGGAWREQMAAKKTEMDGDQMGRQGWEGGGEGAARLTGKMRAASVLRQASFCGVLLFQNTSRASRRKKKAGAHDAQAPSTRGASETGRRTTAATLRRLAPNVPAAHDTSKTRRNEPVCLRLADTIHFPSQTGQGRRVKLDASANANARCQTPNAKLRCALSSRNRPSALTPFGSKLRMG